MRIQEIRPMTRMTRRGTDVEPDSRASLASHLFPGCSHHPVELAFHRVTMIACLVTVLAALATIPARARSDTAAPPDAGALVKPAVAPVGGSGISRFPAAQSSG